jgi:hypothetical protein
MTDYFKRAVRSEQQPSIENSDQLLRLSEAILDYGRMMQIHYSTPAAIVEVPDLANRLRETPAAVRDALRLLEGSGRAVPVDQNGCWKLQPPSSSLRERTGWRNGSYE